MKKFYVIVILLFTAGPTFGQISWEKLISNISTDVFRHVQEVTGGGYIASGYIADSTANDTDAYIIRFNASGDSIWSFRYNGTLSGKDLFYKSIETSDGGFIACGYTTSVTGQSDDILYVKLNASGQLQWAKTYGGNGKDRSQDIVETTDGYTIAGYTTSPPAQYYDAIVIHTDSNGDIIWTTIIGRANYDDANTIKLLPDGGYILGGQSDNSTTGLDQFLIRINSQGDTLWTKRFGTLGTDNIECISVVTDGFVLAGSTNTLATGDDGYLVKTDTAGNVLWTRVFGGAEPDDFHSVQQTNDGGFILGGTTSSSGPLLPNIWLLKTNSNGDSAWAKTFGGDNHDHGYFAIATADGGYAIVGHTGSYGFRNEDAYIVKTGSDGSVANRLKYICAYEMVSPTCAGTASEVKVVVRNFGNEPVSNIFVGVNISGGITQTLNYNIPGPLVPQDLVVVTFSPTINTTGVGSITFDGFTNIVNDVFPQNNSFTKTVTLSPCTGIEELSRSLGFSLFPNPSSGILQIEFYENYLQAEMELINITGEVVKHFHEISTNGMNQSLDLSALAKGLYLLKVTTEKGFDVRRIVLE